MENQTPIMPTANGPQTSEAQQLTVDSRPKANSFLIILLSILLLVSCIIAGFFAYQTQKLAKELQEFRNQELATLILTPTFEPGTEPEQIPLEVLTKDWKTYTDSKQRFSIKYPSTWRIISGDFFGTGPKEIGEDVLWGVNTFDINTNPMSKIIDDLGKQFADRKQTKNEIKVGNLNATQIITTTPTFDDWYSETIIFEDADTIFTVSNGAIKDSNLEEMTGVPAGITFKDFYSTFKFIN